MAEDFDFSKKKKKKKKPTDLDDDAGDAEPKQEVAPVEEKPAPPKVEKPVSAPAGAAEPVAAADDDMDFSLKKKKKKKKIDLLDDVEDQAPPPVAADEPEPTLSAEPAAAEPLDDGADLDLSKKKKKKKSTKAAAEDVTFENEAPEETVTTNNKPAATESDVEYTYDELLDRVFKIMKEKNPDMVAGDKRHIVLKPPQVHRLGTRRTAFANFTEYCKMLHRTPEHFQNFLVAELGASGSVDGSSALVIRGRFQQKQIENVLRRYIREYVTCHTCKSPETTLTKENRLFFLKCESCGSRCSVASIRAGYQAVTGKRAAMRAKTDA